jgi:predicted nucleotidyltransferase component of viral defense system
MRIADVIDESILAIFMDEILSENMVLKGGSAIRLLEQDRSRLSIDADFSVRNSIQEEAPFFERINQTLSRRFTGLGYVVFDFHVISRPRQVKSGHPVWWKGWQCEFKLISKSHSKLSLEAKRRHAFIPEGSNSSKVVIDVSEHEYCGADQKKRIRGIVVHGYSKELLILEKLRAICQQHPEYPYHSNKNRARDFYDIHRLCQGLDEHLIVRCRKHLKAVFDAKEVPIALLKAIWDENFLETQRHGFAQVVDTTGKRLPEFDVYVERLRYIVLQVYPSITAIIGTHR